MCRCELHCHTWGDRDGVVRGGVQAVLGGKEEIKSGCLMALMQ